jgi:uncharacterized membrane protein YcaP (DUF421 family)
MDNMRAERLAMDDLLASARENGIERFDEIRLAVLESNGRISFFTGKPEQGAPETPSVG